MTETKGGTLFKATMGEKRKTVDVSIVQNGDKPLSLDAQRLEVLVQKLGIVRSKMDPPVPNKIDLDIGKTIRAPLSPAFRLDADELNKMGVLRIVHPCFGLLTFGLSEENLESMRYATEIVIEKINRDLGLSN